MKFLKTIWTIILIGISLSSFGQQEFQLLPTEKKQQTLITQPVTIYKGYLRVGSSVEYLNIGTLFGREGERNPIKFNSSLNSWFLRTKIEYGVSDKLQVSLYIPYINQEGSASVREEIPGLGASDIKREILSKGIQDIELQAAYQLLTETPKRPSIALFMNLALPSGEKNPIDSGDPDIIERPTGQGNLALTSNLNVRKIKYPFLYSGRLVYTYRFAGTKSFDLNEPEISFRNAGILDIGGQFGFQVNEWMAILNDINYNTIVGDIMRDGETFESEENYRIDYSPTLTFQAKRLRINQILNFPVMGKNSTADPRFQIGLEYVF